MSKYDDRCAAEGITFIPLAVDSFGGWHGAALDVFSKLGNKIGHKVSEFPSPGILKTLFEHTSHSDHIKVEEERENHKRFQRESMGDDEVELS